MAAAAPTRLSRRVVALLAITAGAAVANLYYIQPLLNLVGDAFGVSDGTAGILVTCCRSATSRASASSCLSATSSSAAG